MHIYEEYIEMDSVKYASMSLVRFIQLSFYQGY